MSRAAALYRGLPLSVCVLAVGSAWAADPPPADGQWRGSATAALAATSGNTDTSSLLIKGDGLRITDSDKIQFGGAINRARSEVDGKKENTADRANLYGQYDWNLSKAMVAFGRLTADRDGMTDLSSRLGASAGLGWKVLDGADDKFTLYGGLGYTTDRYSETKVIGGKSGTSFSRASVMLAEESQHKVTSTVSFGQRLEIDPGISGTKSTLAKFKADLSVAMSDRLSLNVGLLHVYDSKPPLGTKKGDTSLFTGLNLRFGPK